MEAVFRFGLRLVGKARHGYGHAAQMIRRVWDFIDRHYWMYVLANELWLTAFVPIAGVLLILAYCVPTTVIGRCVSMWTLIGSLIAAPVVIAYVKKYGAELLESLEKSALDRAFGG